MAQQRVQAAGHKQYIGVSLLHVSLHEGTRTIYYVVSSNSAVVDLCTLNCVPSPSGST